MDIKELCSHSVTSKNSSCFTPNHHATQVFTGQPKMLVWHKSLAMVSMKMAGFSLDTRENTPRSYKNCQSPSPRGQIGTFCFHRYRYLAAVFVSSISLEDIISHRKALTDFTP